VTNTLSSLFYNGRTFLNSLSLNSFHGATAPNGPRPPHSREFTFTLKHTTFDRTFLDEWSPCCKNLYLATLNTNERHSSPGGIRNHYLSKRAPADSCIRPRGHWDRPLFITTSSVFTIFVYE
jgi:hypothetical protein